MNDNNILLNCNVKDTISNEITLLYKIDTTTAVIWRDTIASIIPFWYAAAHSCELPDGNIIVAFGNNKIHKFNSSGDIIWTRNYSQNTSQTSLQTRSLFPLNNLTYLISGSVLYSHPQARWPYLSKISDTTVTNIHEAETAEYSIFPNPANNSFTIETPLNEFKLSIYNSIGQIVYSTFISQESKIINTEAFPSGVYTVLMESPKFQFAKKLIIR
jgi:hypothetical protein